MAIRTFPLRNRTRLCALRVYKDILMVQTLLWPNKTCPAILEGLDKEAKVRLQELRLAALLIETMAADFEPEKYEDDYLNQLRELIQPNAAGGEAFTRVGHALGTVEALLEVHPSPRLMALGTHQQERAPPPAVGDPGGVDVLTLGGVHVGCEGLDWIR